MSNVMHGPQTRRVHFLTERLAAVERDADAAWRQVDQLRARLAQYEPNNDRTAVR